MNSENAVTGISPESIREAGKGMDAKGAAAGGLLAPGGANFMEYMKTRAREERPRDAEQPPARVEERERNRKEDEIQAERDEREKSVRKDERRSERADEKNDAAEAVSDESAHGKVDENRQPGSRKERPESDVQGSEVRETWADAKEALVLESGKTGKAGKEEAKTSLENVSWNPNRSEKNQGAGAVAHLKSDNEKKENDSRELIEKYFQKNAADKIDGEEILKQKANGKEVAEAAGKSARAEESLALDPEKWKIRGKSGEGENERDPKEIQREALKGARGKKGRSDSSGDFKNNGDESRPAGESRFAPIDKTGNPRSSQETQELFRKNQELFNKLVERARINLGPDGRSSASIRLNPPHLGRMTLNLQMQNNHMHARLVVETEAASKLIQSELDTLRQELKSQGIQVESFQIRVRESAGSFSAENGETRFGRDAQFDNNADNKEEKKGGDGNPAALPSGILRNVEEEYENNYPIANREGRVNISV